MLPSLLSLVTSRPPAVSHIPWLFIAMSTVVLFGVLGFGLFFLRRTFGASKSNDASDKDPVPRADNAPAFMTASMQAVIQKLRDQEKELERLHKAERERAESTARLSEEVTRNMPAGLLVIGSNGVISGANPAAEQALGIKSLLFRRYSEALGESSDLSSLIHQCLTDGTIFRREETTHVAPDGTRRELGVTISPIQRAQEKASGAICLLSDLTALAALHKQMQFRENLAALGELSAGIAHEFKNALATISGYAQMIQSQPDANDAADNAAKILEQTRSITHVVTEFLRYARPLEISHEAIALRPVLERIVSEVRELYPMVDLTVTGEFAEVTGDEALLRQALLNLVRNGAESASNSPNPAVTVRGNTSGGKEGRSQFVHVLDNGGGISPDVASKLFRPFFTTKVNGTGLGLAVVQKILVQHGGQVEASNRVEGGAEFIVTLPAARGAQEVVKSDQVAI